MCLFCVTDQLLLISDRHSHPSATHAAHSTAESPEKADTLPMRRLGENVSGIDPIRIKQASNLSLFRQFLSSSARFSSLSFFDVNGSKISFATRPVMYNLIELKVKFPEIRYGLPSP
jgi:hypothetical protein